MKAVWLEDGELSMREVECPSPPPGEALVKVLRAGICNTDLELVGGYYPFTGILGHEFVGKVVDGPDALVGRRVVGEINAVCDECPACLRGDRSHCERRTVLGIVNRHGAFAEYLTLPCANLHPVPDAVSDDEATFTEPLAAALRIQEQLPITSGDRVLVVGTGKLGQLIARSLEPTGCKLKALGRRAEALALLAAQGVETLTANELAPRSFDIAIECTGNAEGFELARGALRPRGALVMKSTYAGELAFDASALVVDEIHLLGSRCGPFPPALELLESRRVAVADLVERTLPLDRALEAFAQAAAPGVLKILLDPSPA